MEYPFFAGSENERVRNTLKLYLHNSVQKSWSCEGKDIKGHFRSQRFAEELLGRFVLSKLIV